jgi:hypothetical protein
LSKKSPLIKGDSGVVKKVPLNKGGFRGLSKKSPLIKGDLGGCQNINDLVTTFMTFTNFSLKIARFYNIHNLCYIVGRYLSKYIKINN